MLGNLRKKLNHAFQEGLIISESLQQHYLQRISTPSTPVTPTFEESTSSSRSSLGYLSASDLGVPAHLNMEAGCDLLAKYEDDWKNMHDGNEENAEKAEEIAQHIEDIAQRTMAQRIVMTDLVTCLSCLPALVVKLKDSMETLQAVTELSRTAEVQLERLQDLCEECDFQEFVLQKQFELSQYKQKKMVELETYRQKVAAEHQEKIRQHEQRLLQIQRERQAVFDDAFRGDLEEFKQKGMIPKICKEPSKELALEEVDLEDTATQDALEEFLSG